MNWTDQGIILSVNKHGETSAIVNIFTKNYGRSSGYIRGARSQKLRGVVQPGNLVKASWRGRIEEQLGFFNVELIESLPNIFLKDSIKMQAISSVCTLCRLLLPEKEQYISIYNEIINLIFNISKNEKSWLFNYVFWELNLLSSLGFGLDLSSCVVSGQKDNLIWVSPKSGRAVSKNEGDKYRDRLLILPQFLLNNNIKFSYKEVILGLVLTGHFLENHVFKSIDKKMPISRIRLKDTILDIKE